MPSFTNPAVVYLYSYNVLHLFEHWYDIMNKFSEVHEQYIFKVANVEWYRNNEAV